MFWLRNKKINFCYAYLFGGLFNYYTLQRANRKDADQTVQIGLLICGCIVCMQQNHVSVLFVCNKLMTCTEAHLLYNLRPLWMAHPKTEVTSAISIPTIFSVIIWKS